MNCYAGVGSRTTPVDILSLMEEIAVKLCGEGWVLRSGHAQGADQAFERGADGQAEIFLPWEGYERDVPVRAHKVLNVPFEPAFSIAAAVHPGWSYLSQGARKLHARNAHQVLGFSLEDPVSFVVCWTLGAKLKGGTATAIRIAYEHEIPVTNLGDPEEVEIVRFWLAGNAAVL